MVEVGGDGGTYANGHVVVSREYFRIRSGVLVSFLVGEAFLIFGCFQLLGIWDLWVDLGGRDREWICVSML